MTAHEGVWFTSDAMLHREEELSSKLATLSPFASHAQPPSSPSTDSVMDLLSRMSEALGQGGQSRDLNSQRLLNEAVGGLPRPVSWQDLATQYVDVHAGMREDQQAVAQRLKDWIAFVSASPPTKTSDPSAVTIKEVLHKHGGLSREWPSVVDRLVQLKIACATPVS